MNSQMLLNSLMVSDANSLGLLDILFALILPFLLSFPATWIYQKAQASNTYSTAFIHSFFLFASLSSILTLIIGNNIARAFGLIGAFSIIRFRNALKSPIDAVYIFWALSIGMACGTGFYLAALLITVVIGSMALFLKTTNYGAQKRVEAVIRVNVPEKNEDEIISQVESSLKSESIAFSRVNVIFNSNDENKTYVYQVATPDNVALSKIQNKIKGYEGVGSVQSLNSTPSIFAS